MRINIELDTENRADLTALSALIMSLRGDTPEDFGSPDAPPAQPAADAPPPPPTTAAPPASESLIEAEANRAAGAGANAAPELDKTGLPYDDRIHSSTKAVNNDGSWRNKRGVDPALLASVTAELRAKTAQPAADASPPPPAADEPLTPEAAFSPPGEQQPPAPPAPPADTPPPPPVDTAPASDAAPAGVTYPAIIKAANDKGMTYDHLNQTAITLGLAAFKDLVKRPDLFESFMASIG